MTSAEQQYKFNHLVVRKPYEDSFSPYLQREPSAGLRDLSMYKKDDEEGGKRRRI